MRWNPILTGASAAAYVGGIALLMQYVTSLRHDTPDTILDPMAFLSLFVFSAAIMGFLFFYHPALLLLENKKEKAITYFFQMLATFGAITVIVFAVILVM